MRLEQVEEGIQVVSLKSVEQLKPRHVQLKPMMLWTIYKLETARPVHQLRGDPAILGATLIMDAENGHRFVVDVTIEQLLEDFALPGSLEVMTFSYLNEPITHPLRGYGPSTVVCPVKEYGFAPKHEMNEPTTLSRWVAGRDASLNLTHMECGSTGYYATPKTRYECVNSHGQKLGSLTVEELDALNNVLLLETLSNGKSDVQPEPEPENVDMLDMWRDEVRRDNTRLGFDDWVKARRGTFVFTVRLTVPFDKPREVLAGALEANIRSALEDSLDVGRIHDNASGLDVLFVRVE